jgi:hypothetical protein
VKIYDHECQEEENSHEGDEEDDEEEEGDEDEDEDSEGSDEDERVSFKVSNLKISPTLNIRMN